MQPKKQLYFSTFRCLQNFKLVLQLKKEVIFIFNNDNLIIEIIDVLHLYRKKSKYHTPNRPFHILTKRISGFSDMIFEKNTYKIDCSDLIYIPANKEYLRQSYGDEEIIAIHFNILNKNIFSPECIKIDSIRCNDAFRKIYDLWKNKENGYRYKCTSVLYEYLSSIITENHPSQNYLKLEKSINYIENNLDKNICVKELAKMCNLCESQYRKLFRLELGVSPVKYINKLRINSALIKISSEFYTMSQISEMCGFAEQKYFNKVFKEETGKTPSQYKKELLGL